MHPNGWNMKTHISQSGINTGNEEIAADHPNPLSQQLLRNNTQWINCDLIIIVIIFFVIYYAVT